MLEHHVLRRMDDGGRCVMSKIELGRGMTGAGNEECHDSHSLVIFAKTCVSLCRDKILPEIKIIG